MSETRKIIRTGDKAFVIESTPGIAFENIPALLKGISIQSAEGEDDWLYTFTFEAPDPGPAHFTFKPYYERRKYRRYKRRG